VLLRALGMGAPAGLAMLLLSGNGGHTPLAAQSFATVEREVQAGVRRGIYPGAVVIIGRHDRVLYRRGIGRLTWSAGAPRPTPDGTLWDLASLTKVLATASTAARLVDRGQLDLDAPVRQYLPGFAGTGKERVTVRMLLDHTSGLPAWLPLWRETASRDEAIARVLAEPLARPAGASAVYSDLNAILLGLVIERVTGQSLADAAREEVFIPLGLATTRFRPAPGQGLRIAPTDRSRPATARGEVNDQNAAHFGGVAGHAGLFATADDVARFAQAWLRGGVADDGTWVRGETLRAFLQRSASSGTRLLGWDSPDPLASPSVFGTLVSASAYGHTGFTGTELWIDPARDLFLVFLTNRTYDPRVRDAAGAIRLVRARVSDATLRAFEAACVAARVPEARAC